MNVETKIYLDKFQPRDYQVKLFDALENKGYKRALLVWHRRCLSGETHIILANGSFKRLKDIQVGDAILSWDGQRFVPDKVVNVWKTDKKNSVSIKSFGSVPIECSEDHVFATLNRKKDGGSLGWKKIKDIKPRQEIALYNGSSHGSISNPDLAEFLGYMHGDGYVSGYQQPKFTNVNIEILNRVAELTKKLFDYNAIWRKKGNGYDLGLSNGTKGGATANKIKELFRNDGKDVPKKNRTLLSCIWSFDEHSVGRFLAGLLSSDGSLIVGIRTTTMTNTARVMPVTHEVSISCGVNEEYAWEMYWLLRKIGIIPMSPICEKGSNWRIRISRANSIKKILSFGPVFGKQDKQNAILKELSCRKSRDRITRNGCIFAKKKMTPKGVIEMYDIETENNHNFIANGYLVHNSGKDVCAFNFMVRQALKKIGSYYYILPTFKQARLTVFEGMTNDGKKFLDYIPKELISQINKQELKVSLINGSSIYFVGSNDFDSLRGTNPLGAVFSEYAYQHPQVYPTLRPILVANDGWSIFISCVAPSTLIMGENGLKRIKDVAHIQGEYTPFSGKIFGLGGFHEATHFYYGGKKPTRIITLANGYSLECTPVHPIWNGSTWVKSKYLRVGDLIPIQYGQNIWPKDLTFDDFYYKPHGGIKDLLFDIGSPDFFYILGLIHADGSYDKNKICITNKKDRDIHHFLNTLGFKTRTDGIHHELSSKPLCALLEYLGFKHGAKNKVFPEKFLSCSRTQMISFLQGVFDGDGCSNSNPSHGGSISLSSSCREFIEVVKVILLNFGIVSSFRVTKVAPTKLIHVSSTIYQLEITGYFAYMFYENIGFRIERKQRNKKYVSNRCKEDHGGLYRIDTSQLDGYILPKNIVSNENLMTRRVIKKLNSRKPHPYLEKLLEENLFYSKIVSIEESESEVYDFVIPETHSFFSNGFISHNTPFGENHFYALYEVARNSPKEWFCDLLTVDDTGIISPHEIKKEIAEGLMSPDMVEQEYNCSFNVGAIGSYYSKYLNAMEVDGKVSDVPWEPGFPVHTAWDLGMRDQTVILFAQVIGQTIRIIDCYENSDVGLEHYINIAQAKPYTYGKHIAPHDIRVRDYTGGGKSRWDKALDLGLKFNLAPKMSVIDGIEVVRSTLNKVWIDKVKCGKLVTALRDYRKEYDSLKKVYKNHPLHDRNSNWADAMRYLCISLPQLKSGSSAEDIDRRYREAVYGERLPRFFEDTPHY